MPKNPLPKPKSPFPPSVIKAKYPAGGPQTPGAKAKRKKPKMTSKRGR